MDLVVKHIRAFVVKKFAQNLDMDTAAMVF